MMHTVRNLLGEKVKQSIIQLRKKNKNIKAFCSTYKQWKQSMMRTNIAKYADIFIYLLSR
jgi:hypothetical protein